MRLTDHINLMGANPLRAARPLPDCRAFCRSYSGLRSRIEHLLIKAARQTKTKLQHGIYLAVSGPSYRNPAEIRAFARLGADAVA